MDQDIGELVRMMVKDFRINNRDKINVIQIIVRQVKCFNGWKVLSLYMALVI